MDISDNPHIHKFGPGGLTYRKRIHLDNLSRATNDTFCNSTLPTSWQQQKYNVCYVYHTMLYSSDQIYALQKPTSNTILFCCEAVMLKSKEMLYTLLLLLLLFYTQWRGHSCRRSRLSVHLAKHTHSHIHTHTHTNHNVWRQLRPPRCAHGDVNLKVYI